VWQEVGSLFSSQMSDVFSGGVAFNYFPAQADDGQFGMVTISSDGNSVTPSADFTNLVTAYGSASAPTTPSKSDAGSASFPSCPGQNTTFLASSQLPPTPQASACSCIANASPCQYKPKTTNETQVLAYAGSLIDQTCGYLGAAGLTCNDIGANGTTGTYGNLSACDAREPPSLLRGSAPRPSLTTLRRDEGVVPLRAVLPEPEAQRAGVRLRRQRDREHRRGPGLPQRPGVDVRGERDRHRGPHARVRDVELQDRVVDAEVWRRQQRRRLQRQRQRRGRGRPVARDGLRGRAARWRRRDRDPRLSVLCPRVDGLFSLSIPSSLTSSTWLSRYLYVLPRGRNVPG
jgi:hypothetical protein